MAKQNRWAVAGKEARMSAEFAAFLRGAPMPDGKPHWCMFDYWTGTREEAEELVRLAHAREHCARPEELQEVPSCR